MTIFASRGGLVMDQFKKSPNLVIIRKLVWQALCNHMQPIQFTAISFCLSLHKGPFKYYVIKEVGGWGCQMMMFDDKLGGWGLQNDDVIRRNAHHQYQNLLEIYLSFRGYN